VPICSDKVVEHSVKAAALAAAAALGRPGASDLSLFAAEVRAKSERVLAAL
jgi:hypothetical protein